MLAGELLLLGGNAWAFAILVNAGIAKFVNPEPLRQALREFLPTSSPVDIRRGAIRLLSVLEVTTALMLLNDASRQLGAIVIAALGGSFAVLGVAGRLHRASRPCGCMGGQTDEPFGLFNLLIGICLIVVALLNLQTQLTPKLADIYPAWTAIASGVATIGFCVWLHRMLVWTLLKVRRGGSAPGRPAFVEKS